MKITGIIPSRYASSRFPGKPLLDLKGKSMIQRVYEGASKSKALSEVIVATDDQRIFDAVQEFGGKVVMTGEHHTTGTDRCAEVAVGIEADVIMNIQGDEPLIDARQIDQLCSLFNNEEVQIGTLGITSNDDEERNNPNRIKLVLGADKRALYFSRSPIPNNDRGQSESFHRHIGLYAYRKNTLLELTRLEPTELEKTEALEQLRWMYYGYPIHVNITEIETPNIDVPEDVEKVLAQL